jgi:hypothetical protein
MKGKRSEIQFTMMAAGVGSERRAGGGGYDTAFEEGLGLGSACAGIKSSMLIVPG